MLYRPPSLRSVNGVRVALALAIVVVCYQLYTLAFQIYKDSQIDIQYHTVMQENTQMRREITELTQLVAYLQTPGYRELEQRKIANLVKPGEKVILLERPSSMPQPAATSVVDAAVRTGESATPETIPLRWWQYLFGEEELATRPVDRDVAPLR